LTAITRERDHALIQLNAEKDSAAKLLLEKEAQTGRLHQSQQNAITAALAKLTPTSTTQS
jgi:hypothetical protein